MKNRVSIMFAVPSLIIYTSVIFFPVLLTFFYSITDWNGLTPQYSIVGLKNYSRILYDQRFLMSVWNSFKFVLIVVVLVNVLGLVYAVLLNKVGRLTNLIRTIFVMPIVVSQVASAFIWSTMYSYNGILNFLLGFFGVDAASVGWITDQKIALYSVIAVDIWRIMGFHMVIYLAALQTIPASLYEAADIDGCSGFQRFRHITIPLIIPGAIVSLVLSTIGALKQYDLVKVLTDGGPGFATETIAYNIINMAFESNNLAYACATAFALFLTIALITLLQKKLLSSKLTEY